MRYAMAAAALTLGVDGVVLIRALQWQGLIFVFVGGCLWWVSLHLSRSAWRAKQAAMSPRPAPDSGSFDK